LLASLGSQYAAHALISLRRFSSALRLGNPHNLSLAGPRGRAIQISAANEFAQTVLPVIRAIQVAGTTSLASIADVLNERGRIGSFLLQCMSLLLADSVAKVFLRYRIQILRAVGAAIE